MRDKMYAIQDTKLAVFFPPTCYNNQAHAFRSLSDVFSKDNLFRRHYRDFIVYEIGQFCHETGVVETQEKKQVFTGADLMAAVNEREESEKGNINAGQKN